MQLQPPDGFLAHDALSARRVPSAIMQPPAIRTGGQTLLGNPFRLLSKIAHIKEAAAQWLALAGELPWGGGSTARWPEALLLSDSGPSRWPGSGLQPLPGGPLDESGSTERPTPSRFERRGDTMTTSTHRIPARADEYADHQPHAAKGSGGAAVGGRMMSGRAA